MTHAQEYGTARNLYNNKLAQVSCIKKLMQVYGTFQTQLCSLIGLLCFENFNFQQFFDLRNLCQFLVPDS